MKISKTQKEAITKNVHKINEMDISKLNLFVQELYLSKPYMDEVVFKWTMRGADIKAMELRESTTMSPMVVLSEFRGDDLK